MAVYLWVLSQPVVLHAFAFGSTLLPFSFMAALVGVRLSGGDDDD